VKVVGAKGFEPSTSWSRMLDKLVIVRTVLPNIRACRSAPLEQADIRAYELGRHFEWIRPQQTEHRPDKSGTEIPRS
jgi:hypothetical protein